MNPRTIRPLLMAPVFSALGDPMRLAIVADLCKNGPTTTVRLTTAASVSRQAVTKQLQTLQVAGIVSSCRKGRDRQWQIEKLKLKEACAFLDQISIKWDATLDRLRRFVEEGPQE